MASASGVIWFLVPVQGSASGLPNYGPLIQGKGHAHMAPGPGKHGVSATGGYMKKEGQRERKEVWRDYTISNLSIGRK